jgi:hypothetical protein
MMMMQLGCALVSNASFLTDQTPWQEKEAQSQEVKGNRRRKIQK